MGCCSFVLQQPQRSASLSGYTFQEVLGAGAYGQVRSCFEASSGMVKAVKIVHLGNKMGRLEKLLGREPARDTRALADEERSLWEECCGHKCVLRLYDSVLTDTFAFFVMEKCECSLLELLEEDRANLDEKELVVFYYQMLSGIEHVHSKGVIHRDVKPANFLLSDGGSMKLCDFGLSVRREEGGNSPDTAGSPLFMSPEMVARKPYGCIIDIWALGVTVYLISFGNYPYFGDGQTRESLERSICSDFPAPTYTVADGWPAPSPSIVDFIRQLLMHSQLHRKSASRCLRLAALKSSKWHDGGSNLKAVAKTLKRSLSQPFSINNSGCSESTSAPEDGSMNTLGLARSCTGASVTSSGSRMWSTHSSNKSTLSIGSQESIKAQIVLLRRNSADIEAMLIDGDQEADFAVKNTQHAINDELKNLDPTFIMSMLEDEATTSNDAQQDEVFKETTGSLSTTAPADDAGADTPPSDCWDVPADVRDEVYRNAPLLSPAIGCGASSRVIRLARE